MAQLVLLSALVASYMCYVYGQSSCRTPSGAGGSCISIYECSELLTIVNNPNKSQQDTELLRASHCGYEGNVPNVCCPAQAREDSCYTPEWQPGRCVGIQSCQHLADMLKPPIPQDTVAFLQNSRCDGPEQYSVCCGPPRGSTPASGPKKVCTLTSAPPDPITRCCGRETGSSDKITGGNATTVDQYPWLVIIEYLSNTRISLLCGGALISGRYALTAGHCVVGYDPSVGVPTNVRLGEYDTSNEGSDCTVSNGGGQDCTDGITVIPIEKIIAHPQYDPSARHKRNDIALLRLKNLAPYTEFIRPICLPATDVTASLPLENNFYAAGWGAVNSTVRKSQKKLHVDLPFVSNAVCQQGYKKALSRDVDLWKGQLCAGGEDGKDSCRGDSGGPLMYETIRGYFDIIGIVSFGPTPCGIENVPGVYTKVFEYISWIRSQIKP